MHVSADIASKSHLIQIIHNEKIFSAYDKILGDHDYKDWLDLHITCRFINEHQRHEICIRERLFKLLF